MMNIAIDGPSSAGKSTVAKLIASRLNIVYVDTGAMYRALGLKALCREIDPANGVAVEPMLKDTSVEFKAMNGEMHIMLDGEDVSSFIRTEEVSSAASVISTHQCVRERLVELQREIAANTDTVMDGRDIGTVVLPNSKYKFFITASVAVRARRRYEEYLQKGKLHGKSFEQVLAEIKARDFRDMNREIAPLRPAADAVIVNTDEMSIEQVVNALLEVIG